MTWYAVVTIVLTIVGAVLGTAFIVDYHRLSMRGRRHGRRGWWESEIGWFLMLYPTSLTLVFAFVLFSRLLGESLIRRIIGITLYSGLVCTLPWLHRVMRKSQRRMSRDDTDELPIVEEST